MGLAPRPYVGMFGETVMTILVQRFGDLQNMFVQIPLPTSPQVFWQLKYQIS